MNSKWYIPDTTFYMQEYAESETGGCSIDGVPSFEWKIKRASELFANKRVVIFALPGAFTPTCSSQQLPGFDIHAELFAEHGVDEVWCTAVNDAFVMRSWEVDQQLRNVKMLPDGNGDFAKGMDMLVDKRNLGFGMRSWRYAMVVNNCEVEYMAAENGWSSDLAPADPYEVSTPEAILSYLSGTPATDDQMELDF